MFDVFRLCLNKCQVGSRLVDMLGSLLGIIMSTVLKPPKLWDVSVGFCQISSASVHQAIMKSTQAGYKKWKSLIDIVFDLMERENRR